MSEIIKFLKDLVANAQFTREQMYDFCKLFANAPATQQSAILALFSSRGETIEELIGALRYLLEQAKEFNYPNEIIDIVGTGGDGAKTFNISTAASIVIASCGIKVAKHGGRSVTSASGSVDVLEELRIPIYIETDQICSSLDRNNFAILLAPVFNPFFKSFGTLRKELGIPTLLNILGPIANPMRPERQVIGVYRKDLVNKIAQVLQQTGSKHAMVVYSLDGLDELSISAPTYIAELKEGTIYEYQITPEVVGLKRASVKEIEGGSPKENAKIIIEILSGEQTGAPLDVVIMNAAAGLVVGGCVDNLIEGINVAREVIISGQALKLFKEIIKGEL